jgi:hypothetical protein
MSSGGLLWAMVTAMEVGFKVVGGGQLPPAIEEVVGAARRLLCHLGHG